MKELILAGVLASSLTGCHTMEYLEKVGDGYGKGDYIFSSVMLVFTPLMLVPDVFTLGGFLDDQQTSDLWLGAATQYAANEESNRALQQQQAALQQQYTQQQAAAAAESARQQAWNEQNQRAWELQQQAKQAESSQVNSGGGNTTSGGFTYTSNVNSCVSIRPNENVKNAQYMYNTCSFPIRVLHCTEGVVGRGDFKGKQVSNCSNRLFGDKTLAAGSRDLHNYAHVGAVTHFIACPDPFYIPGSKVSWGSGGFQGRCQK